MKTVIIDFSKCKCPMDLHDEIREKLELPLWYGNNLDALWDMLTGFIETPISISLFFKPESKNIENLRESVLKIIETFKEAEEYDDELKLHYEI